MRAALRAKTPPPSIATLVSDCCCYRRAALSEGRQQRQSVFVVEVVEDIDHE